MSDIMVLNDGETYTSYEGCFAVEVVRDMDTEPLQEGETFEQAVGKVMESEQLGDEFIWCDKEEFYIGKIVQEF